MKKLFLLLATATALHAQSSIGYTINTGSLFLQQSEPRVTMKPNGDIMHRDGVQITVVSFNQTKLVLECLGRPYSHDRWREIWEIRDGKLVQTSTIEPKIIPASDERVEWPEEAAK